MGVYVYGFNLELCQGEVFFRFPKFPEVISAVGQADFELLGREQIYQHAEDAVVTALQTRIVSRTDIPPPDQAGITRASGFVTLSTLQSMKMELYRLYKENSSSTSDLARQLSKPETSIRRLLDLRHRSVPAEIDVAVSIFGKKFVSDVRLEPATSRIAIYTGEKTKQPLTSQP